MTFFTYGTWLAFFLDAVIWLTGSWSRGCWDALLVTRCYLVADSIDLTRFVRLVKQASFRTNPRSRKENDGSAFIPDQNHGPPPLSYPWYIFSWHTIAWLLSTWDNWMFFSFVTLYRDTWHFLKTYYTWRTILWLHVLIYFHFPWHTTLAF